MTPKYPRYVTLCEPTVLGWSLTAYLEWPDQTLPEFVLCVKYNQTTLPHHKITVERQLDAQDYREIPEYVAAQLLAKGQVTGQRNVIRTLAPPQPPYKRFFTNKKPKELGFRANAAVCTTNDAKETLFIEWDNKGKTPYQLLPEPSEKWIDDLQNPIELSEEAAIELANNPKMLTDETEIEKFISKNWAKNLMPPFIRLPKLQTSRELETAPTAKPTAKPVIVDGLKLTPLEIERRMKAKTNAIWQRE
jgi:hypothetical protein